MSILKLNTQGLKLIFSQLTEAKSKVIWIRDVDHSHHIYISPAYERIWGRKRDELYEHPSTWKENLAEINDPEVIRKLITRSPSTSDDENTVFFRVFDMQANTHWMKDTCFYLFDQLDQYIAVAGISEEISQAQWEQESAEHNKRIHEKQIEEGLFNIIEKKFNLRQKIPDEDIKRFTFVDAKELIKLTEREAQCLSYLSAGKSTKNIAKALAISPKTVDIYINNLKKKFDCHTRIELISKLVIDDAKVGID